jgi:hypothetical protein
MSVILKWKSGANATSYQVWRHTADVSGSATMIADNVAGTRYEDTTATAGVLYYYWLKAKNSLGTSAFSTPSISITGTLRAPRDVVATLTSDTETAITWAAVTGAATYLVQRSTTAAFTSPSTVGTTAGTTINDTTGDADTAYYYRVIARNANTPSGDSAPSLLAIGYRSEATPAAPGAIAATDNEEDQITVSWSIVSGAQVYDVYQNTVNNSATATLIATVANVLSYADTSVTRGTSYYYWIKARNYTGSSAFTLAAVGISPALASPSSVGATDDQNGFIEVTWFTGTGFITGYKIWRNTVNNSATATAIATVGGSTLIFVDDDAGLAADTAYFYWVTALEGATDGGFSGWDEGMMTSTISAPSAPTGVSASGDRPDKVRVSWAGSVGASSYSVWRYTADTSGSATQIATGVLDLYYDDTSASVGVTYYYWVKATNTGGTSGFSFSDSGVRNSDGIRGASLSSSGNYDHNYTLDVGGTINLSWSFSTKADRIRIYNNAGTMVGDTGCVTGTGTLYNIGVTAGTVRVLVDADCAAVGGAASLWSFTTT